MYFFHFSAYGGWYETDRRYYPNYQSCIEAQEKYEIDNPFPNRIKVKCQEVKK